MLVSTFYTQRTDLNCQRPCRWIETSHAQSGWGTREKSLNCGLTAYCNYLLKDKKTWVLHLERNS